MGVMFIAKLFSLISVVAAVRNEIRSDDLSADSSSLLKRLENNQNMFGNAKLNVKTGMNGNAKLNVKTGMNGNAKLNVKTEMNGNAMKADAAAEYSMTCTEFCAIESTGPCQSYLKHTEHNTCYKKELYGDVYACPHATMLCGPHDTVKDPNVLDEELIASYDKNCTEFCKIETAGPCQKYNEGMMGVCVEKDGLDECPPATIFCGNRPVGGDGVLPSPAFYTGEPMWTMAQRQVICQGATNCLSGTGYCLHLNDHTCTGNTAFENRCPMGTIDCSFMTARGQSQYLVGPI